jgi:aurora kinase
MSGNSYDEKIDLWAIGVLGYEMMTGRIPFDIKSEKDLSKIVTSKIIFPKNMSQNAISFLEVLLERDPNKRKDIM